MKNRLGRQVGTTFDAKLACQGQIGAKMGKLTLLGGLRGTKLELKEALEAAEKAPRGPRYAMALFEQTATTLIPCAAHVPPRCRGETKSRSKWQSVGTVSIKALCDEMRGVAKATSKEL